MSVTRRMLLMSGGALATLTAAGCSVTGAPQPTGAGSAAGGDINILLMKQAGWTEADWAGVFEAFSAANPGLTVNPTFVAYEALHDKIVTSAAAGTYDVIQVDVIWPPEFAEKKMIVDVTDRVPAAWGETMQGGALQAALYQDRYFGAPSFPSTKLFFYNNDMLTKVGATVEDVASWTGVMDVARELKSAGVCEYPLAWSWAQAEAVICDFAQLLGAFGGTFTDASGQLNFNDAAGQQTLQFMVDTLADGTTAPGSTTFLEDDVIKSMQSGDTAFCLNWESTFRELNDESASQVVGQCGVMATPVGESGAQPGVNGAMALAITAGSSNQDNAWKFIEFAVSREVQDPLAQSAMPNWVASYSDPDVVANAPEVFTACQTAYADSILRPQVVNYNTVSAILQVEIQKALLGDKSVTDALNDAVEQGNASLEG
ncbi:MAG: extracellular solute-binding protein [Propioniciclava sp.]